MSTHNRSPTPGLDELLEQANGLDPSVKTLYDHLLGHHLRESRAREEALLAQLQELKGIVKGHHAKVAYSHDWPSRGSTSRSGETSSCSEAPPTPPATQKYKTQSRIRRSATPAPSQASKGRSSARPSTRPLSKTPAGASRPVPAARSAPLTRDGGFDGDMSDSSTATAKTPKGKAKVGDEEKTKSKGVATSKRKRGYGVKKDEVPEEAGNLREAMLHHIRILWNLLDSKAIPHDPPPAVLEKFSKEFATEAQLNGLITDRSRPSTASTNAVQVSTTSAANSSSRILSNHNKVDDSIVGYMKACVARFGFSSWNPDLRQNPKSLYNSACRIIAIDTFQQALISGAYNRAFSVNTRYTTNVQLLIKLYDNFVFNFFVKRYKRDVRDPGSVARTDGRSITYKKRERLCKARQKFIKENGYPARYQRLITTDATSEDERDPQGQKKDGRPIFIIQRKPWRSEALNTFIRKLDSRREAASMYSPRGISSSERYRVLPQPGFPSSNSVLKRLPTGFPIEGYEPNFYNELPPAIRERCAFPEVVFPRDLGELFTKTGDERLSAQQLMDNYRKDALGVYDIVMQQDLKVDDEEDFAEYFATDEEEEISGDLDEEMNEIEENLYQLSQEQSLVSQEVYNGGLELEEGEIREKKRKLSGSGGQLSGMQIDG